MTESHQGLLILPSSHKSIEGIFYFSYWLTDRNQSAFVDVKASSRLWGDPYSLVNYTFTGNCYIDCVASGNDNNSNFLFHLQKHSVRLTNYAIKTRPNGTNFLMNWKFEGSNNGETWTELDSHQDSDDLCGNNITKVYKVRKNGLFSYFRLLQTGINSLGNHHLVLNNIELFGKLCPNDDEICSISSNFRCSLKIPILKDLKPFLFTTTLFITS